MIKSWAALGMGFLLMVTGAKAAIAETVLEKVARTGTLTLGANLNNVPFAYVNDKDEVVGYSIDLAERIRAEVETYLGRPVTLVITESGDVTQTIPQLIKGEIDLACDTAFTWERDKYVDFTVSYGVTGMQLLLPANSSITSVETLENRKIALVPNSVAAKTLKLVQDKAQIVPVKSLQEGLEALRAGKVEGVAGDGLLLDGWRQVLGMKDTKLVPESPKINYGVGCMVPHNNPAFLRLANLAIVKLAEGYFYGDAPEVALINQWFGPQGVVQLDPQIIRNFFNYLLITHEQIPDTFRQPAQPASK